MRTFAISLARSKERRSYIEKHLTETRLAFELVDAVDGSTLTDADIEKYCDTVEVKRRRWWLTNGAIGCALSHLHVYEKIVEQNLESAFVIEDDAILPANINDLLAEISQKLKSDEIILLYYASFKVCNLSTAGKETIQDGGLLYPMDMDQPMTATAYIISYGAAKKMARAVLPIRVAADSWGHYFSKGAFSSFRCFYPMPVRTMHFKSTIDYVSQDSWKAFVSGLIDKYKIPPFFRLLRWLRKRRTVSMLNKFELTSSVSPVYRNSGSTGFRGGRDRGPHS